MLGALCWSFPLSETSCVDWRARAAGRRKKQKKRRSGGSCGCRILGGEQTRAEGRARLCLGTHPAGEERTVVWAPWFDFISWITAFPPLRSGHDRLYSLESAHWKLSGRVAWTRVRGLSMWKWMNTRGNAFTGFLTSEQFPSKFHLFVPSRSFSPAARHVLTA